ncbi:MAG: hypothetical protein JXM68_06970, partial [Sedimentisphaerales bacterium]|nr:hypothetical protein [Sedimentisphaerales bacterium]
MAKKIILITAALLGVLLLGLIFQFINNDLGDTTDIYLEPELDKSLLQETTAQIEAIKAGEVSFSTSEGVVFQVPGKREFGYEKRVSNDQGMFQILNPWVKLYSQDNIVRITAQKGLVPINNDTQSLSSGGPDQG